MDFVWNMFVVFIVFEQQRDALKRNENMLYTFLAWEIFHLRCLLPVPIALTISGLLSVCLHATGNGFPSAYLTKGISLGRVVSS